MTTEFKYEIVHIDTCVVMVRFNDLELGKAETAALNANYGPNYVLCHSGGFAV